MDEILEATIFRIRMTKEVNRQLLHSFEDALAFAGMVQRTMEYLSYVSSVNGHVCGNAEPRNALLSRLPCSP